MHQEDINFIHKMANISDHYSELYLKNKKIFITGGTGFIGRWLVFTLNSIKLSKPINFEIYLLTRDKKSFIKNYSKLSKDVNFIEGSIEDKSVLREIKIEFDYVFHFAGETTKGHDYLAELAEVSVVGTNNLLKYVISNKTQYCFFASSGAVYSSFLKEGRGLREEDPCVFDSSYPDEIYAISKRLAEKILESKLKKSNCKLISLRIFALVGPSMYFDKHYAFGNFISSAVRKRDIQLSTDGSVYRSFMHIRDFMIWILKLLEMEESNKNLFLNVGSDDAISVKDLAQRISEEYSVGLKTSDKKAINKKYYVPDIMLAKSMGLEIYTPLNESIKLTYKSVLNEI